VKLLYAWSSSSSSIEACVGSISVTLSSSSKPSARRLFRASSGTIKAGQSPLSKLASPASMPSASTTKRLAQADRILQNSKEMLPCLRYKKLGLKCVVSSKDSKHCEVYVCSNCCALCCTTGVSIAECKLSTIILATGLSAVRARR
jgi:hypothetical protein